MNKSDKPNSLTINEVYDIKKEHEALMKRNDEIMKWMKQVGLIK